MVMLLEYCLVLGFVVPVILPLAWCTFVLHLAVFYRANISGSAVKLVMDTKPSSLYLHGSLMVGCALMMWFFVENDLHGQTLLVVGIPVMFLAASACISEHGLPLTSQCEQRSLSIRHRPYRWS